MEEKIKAVMKTKQTTLGAVVISIVIFAAVTALFATSAKGETETAPPGQPEPERTEISQDPSDRREVPLYQVMDRILSSRGLDQALDYRDKVEDTTADQIVLLCTSESGKYEAYGFVSPEYGTAGILLNNIIDGEDNWNYLEEIWSYGDVKPALEEKGEYEVLFSFPQDGTVRQLCFDAYDTGTVSLRE